MSTPEMQLPPEDEIVVEQSWVSRVGSFFLEAIKIAFLAGITIALVRYFLFKPFYVKGQSMEPNFEEHDYLIIDELSYRFRAPERGEVVVFHSPINNDFYLKRVVALPGERVKVDGNKVIVYNDEHLEGKVLEEKYLTEVTTGSVTYTLSDNEYFVMGDNRDASYDSRRFGPINKSALVGRVWLRGWPFARVGTFTPPAYNL